MASPQLITALLLACAAAYTVRVALRYREPLIGTFTAALCAGTAALLVLRSSNWDLAGMLLVASGLLALTSIVVLGRCIEGIFARRKREVERGEARYRRIIGTTREGIWSFDAAGRTSFVNPQMAEMLGYEPHELLGRLPLEFVTAEQRDAAADALARAHEVQQVQLETRLLRRDGTPIWARFSISGIHAEDGSYDGALAMVNDISRERLETMDRLGRGRVLEQVALGASLEEVLTTLCEYIEEVRPGVRSSVMLLNPDGRTLRLGASPSLPATFREALDGIEVGPTVGSCGAAVARGRNVIAADIASHINWAPYRDLARLHSLGACWSAPVHAAGGQVLGALAFYYERPREPDDDDLALMQTAAHLAGIAVERRRTEDELAETQALLLAAIESCPAGIVIADAPDGRIRLLNSAARAMRGGDEPGTSTWTALYPNGEQMRPEDAPLSQAIQNGRTSKNVEALLRNPSGALTWVLANAAPVLNAQGEVTAGVLVFPNITDLKLAEREREQLLRALRAQNEELEGIFHATSHDLRAPLVNIDGFGRELELACTELASRLARALPGNDSGSLQEILEQDMLPSLGYVRSSTRKMERLLTGLKRLSGPGRAPVAIEDVDMNALMAELVDGLRFQVHEAGAVVTVGELPPCRGDASQISQVFTNLLDNALKYLDPERPGIVHISGEGDGLVSRYSVRDNGIGIDPAHQGRIFEVFHRLDPNGPIAGEGLGLTILARILERHAGRIEVESSIGVGSEFQVSLPAVRARVGLEVTA